MRLVKFLNSLSENSIAAAIKLPEPDDTKEYPKDEVEDSIATLTAAIKALRAKSEPSALDKSSLADFTENLRGWSEIYKSRFGGTSNVDKLVGKAPKKVTAPIDPDGPMDPALAIKLAGVEEPEAAPEVEPKKKSKKDKK